MGIFQEYLNSKGKVETGKVDIHGDQVDPQTPPTKPEGDSGVKPYSASDGKSVSKKDEKGFGDKGDKDLIFNYDTEKSSKKAAKIPTAEQRFANRELLPMIRESISNDPLLIEELIRDFKRNGLLHLVVAEMMEHKETYQHISELMKHEAHGPEICRKLYKSMSEEVASPFHTQFQKSDEPDENEDDMDDEVLGADENDDDMIMRDPTNSDEMSDMDDMDDSLGFEDEEAPENLEDHPAPKQPLSNKEMMSFLKKMMGKY